MVVAVTIRRSVVGPLSEFMGFVGRIGGGDLSTTTAATGKDELGRLGMTLNDMVGGLRTIATQNRAATENLNAAATEIRASTQEQAASVEEQLAAVQETAATVDEITDDFNLTPARVRTDMKILRDWLGVDPGSGTSFLPDARTTPAALQRGVAVYQLDGALCDWHLFERLRAAANETEDSSRKADALQAALDLVTGRPFEHARPAGWGWLFEGDRVDLHVTQAVGAVAVELVGYHRARRDDKAADGEGCGNVSRRERIDGHRVTSSQSLATP